MTGVKVKVGSPCVLKWMGKPYRGKIKEIRGRTKMFLVEFTTRQGKINEVWKHARELSPFQGQEDAGPTQVRVLSPPPEAENGNDDAKTAP